jgi:DNA-directed RNA polymerase subunit RPC12/RpoP
LIYQCDRCGGLVDPRYGTDDDSWCPHCDAIGSIVAMEGQIPMPALYGDWVRQQRQTRSNPQGTQRPPPIDPTTRSTFPASTGGSNVKTAKTHTGTYSCLNCMTEFDLVAETHLKCDECGGPLLQGSLDELCDEDFDGEDDPA